MKPHRMKAYGSFAEWKRDQSARNQWLIVALAGIFGPARMSMRVIAPLAALFLGACDSGTPEYVYLRTSSVVVTVTAQAESRVRAGDWLRLRASRATTGEWRKLRFAEMPKDTPWLGEIPPAHEAEVAANLRWFADPSDGVEFNNPVTGVVEPMERAVKFPRPGSYRLWATSHPPMDATSNTLQIEVTARD